MDLLWAEIVQGRREADAVRKQVAQLIASDQLDMDMLISTLDRVEELIAKTVFELACILNYGYTHLDTEQRKDAT